MTGLTPVWQKCEASGATAPPVANIDAVEAMIEKGVNVHLEANCPVCRIPVQVVLDTWELADHQRLFGLEPIRRKRATS